MTLKHGQAALFLITALAIACGPAYGKCHVYKYWAFKFPQRCFGQKLASVRNEAPFVEKRSPLHFGSEVPFAAEPDIPLPSLARTDLDGGWADEATRARLLLRAALEAPDAH
jgi:hypothetical protein